MSNFYCPQCGETNIDSPDGYVKGCECLKPDMECLPMSKQLEEEARQQMHGGDMFWFTPEQLKAYRTALCREQREICAKSLDWADAALHGQIFAETTIKNAPEPG